MISRRIITSTIISRHVVLAERPHVTNKRTINEPMKHSREKSGVDSGERVRGL